MSKVVTIAIDAMGGDGSPKKVIDGIIHHSINTSDVFYQIFGDKTKIEKLISDKLNNNLWFSLEQQTSKGTMSRNTNGNSNREDSDFDTRTVYANLRYYLTDILDELSFQTGLIYRDWEAKSLIIDNSNDQRKGVYRVMYPENGYNFGLGLNWFYTNGFSSSLNFVKIISDEPSVDYELEGNYECNLSCQEDFEAKVEKYSPTNLFFFNFGFSF